MICAIADEQHAWMTGAERTLCWIRVEPHHYGLLIDVFDFEPTEQTLATKAIARFNLDAFNNILSLVLWIKGMHEQIEDIEPTIVLGTIRE